MEERRMCEFGYGFEVADGDKPSVAVTVINKRTGVKITSITFFARETLQQFVKTLSALGEVVFPDQRDRG